MEGLRELDGPVCVIGDVDVLGPANVDVPRATVSVPSGQWCPRSRTPTYF